MTTGHRLTISEPGGFWFFAYGSLMWDPPFEPECALPARLYGWHRAFCVSSETYRGTPQAPGLTLGLNRGGSCAGIALRIGAASRETTIRSIEKREMEDDPIYICRQVVLHLPNGRATGYTLVVNREDRIFSGDLGFEEIAQRIASSEGSRGRNIEYLANTVEQLRNLGVAPGRLGILHRRTMEIDATYNTIANRRETG